MGLDCNGIVDNIIFNFESLYICIRVLRLILTIYILMIKENNSNQPDKQKDKVVALNDLISDPECLKLLILHTPFTVQINTLHLCTNLVKLDLSKNKISTFPFLGSLSSLKFILIHQNQLGITDLIGIFEQQPDKRSILSKSVVWVTYWGNQNQFQGRHYLATSTNALAVDLFMVCPEQKNAVFTTESNQHKVAPFSDEASISDIFYKKKKFNKTATEDQYMKDFWDDVGAIRKKYLEILPIIKIQKVFRGYMVRKHNQIQKQSNLEKLSLQKTVLSAWRRQIKYDKKIKAILSNKNKQHLLLPLQEMRKQIINLKMIALAKQAKRRYGEKIAGLKMEYRFYKTLKSHQNWMNDLYESLHIQDSSKVYITSDQEQIFQDFIFPFVRRLNTDLMLETDKNKNAILRWIAPKCEMKNQSLNILKNNQQSVIYLRKQSTDISRYPNYLSVFKTVSNLKPLYNYRNIHLSTKQKQRQKVIEDSLQYTQKIVFQELKVISADSSILKDITRGVYFYNVGYLTSKQKPRQKLNLITEYYANKISSILKIQKMWKGYILRKKHGSYLAQQFKERRAAVRIQKWFRGLSFSHRSNFMKQNIRYFKKFESNSFYIKFSDYYQIVNHPQLITPISNLKNFPEQHIAPYLDKKTDKLSIYWRPQSSSLSFTNFHNKKCLFYPGFMKEIIGPDFQAHHIDINTDNCHQKYGDSALSKISQPKSIKPSQDFMGRYEQMEISHIFHYQTKVSLINRRCKQEADQYLKQNSDNNLIQYLEVKCNSKHQCRLRVLALKLLSYTFKSGTIYRDSDFILPHEYEIRNQAKYLPINQKIKVPIGNNQAVFISETNSPNQIISHDSHSLDNLTELQFLVKFYLKPHGNLPSAHPIKIQALLKLILLQNPLPTIKHSKKNRIERESKRKYDHYTMDRNFRQIQIDRFLISDKSNVDAIPSNNAIKSEILEYPQQHQQHPYIKNLYKNHQLEINLPVNPNPPERLKKAIEGSKKKDLANIKAERLFKLKKKKQLRELKQIQMEEKFQYNQLVHNGKYYINKYDGTLGSSKNQRINTQPDLLVTQQRSIGTMASDLKNVKSMKSIPQEDYSQKKRMQRNDCKNTREKAMSFVTNFMNKGNFIQKQVLQSHIKRIKTEQDYQSQNRHGRIKTEEDEIKSEVKKFKQNKQKQIKIFKQQHKDLLLQSSVQKSQSVKHESINERRKSRKLLYGSQGKKLKISFAEECYPIINRRK